VPAAAVIPAPGAHIFVAAVKKSVVGREGVRGIVFAARAFDTVSKLQFSKLVIQHGTY
jgi:hypothetical protein